MERIWDLVNSTSKEMVAAMRVKVKSLHAKGRPHFRRQDIKVAFILQFIARGRELKRLQRIGEEFEDFVVHSHRRREEFSTWAESEKAEKIVRVMEGLEVEVRKVQYTVLNPLLSYCVRGCANSTVCAIVEPPKMKDT